MRPLQRASLLALGALALAPLPVRASNHREAPITALDHKADITDVYAFASYDAGTLPGTAPSKVTLMMCVDPLLDPANGPTLFPFDPNILYEIKVDNDHDGLEDKVFQFRFRTEYQLPDVFTSVAGVGATGAFEPGTSNLVVPPRITDFDDLGLNQRQPYTAHLFDVNAGTRTLLGNGDGSPMYAVPANAGSRTMSYSSLYDKGTYAVGDGVSVFCGTVDDPFFIDLGAAFDTLNFRMLGSGVPGVLTADEDSANQNFASDTVSGFAVNAIAVEVPIELLTSTGNVEPASAPEATIGVWATTSRPRVTVRRPPEEALQLGDWRQVQRLGNPLINELVIGIGSKDRFSMDVPSADAQFQGFFLDPPVVRIAEALYGGALAVPAAPRLDLLPLVTYAAPIAAPGTPAGPIADMLRLNTGVGPTPRTQVSRLGLLGGDPAGFPNGRRPFDDVVDVTLRVAVGGVLAPPFAGFDPNVNGRLGDGVNVNDRMFNTTFPYVAHCPNGRNRRHIDPGEAGGGPVQ